MATETLLKLEPTRRVEARAGGEVARVALDSPAASAGLRAGDWLVAINGLCVRDVIDYSYEAAGDRLELIVDRGGALARFRVNKDLDQELGLEFTTPVFEGVRECNNNCEFCFIRGLPKGLRRSLYIRDDDYRYSYLFGSFLTLTNLGEADWERIGFQRLSPLHVSVHATDLAVRRAMLANPAAPDILKQLDRLGSLGVQVKAQVVLCPGQNDGPVLARTVADLRARAATVDSVAIVPVGLSRYSSTTRLRSVTSKEARDVVQSARVWQRTFRKDLGRDLVYLSDELYLLAGQQIPPAWRYDGYPQLQNGVGLTRLLLDDWAAARRGQLAELQAPRRVAWVCGRAAAPALTTMASDLSGAQGLDLRVVEVSNSLFGGAISVSGLLAGSDITGALADCGADLVVLPHSAFGFEARETLDGWTPADIQHAAGVRVGLATTASELLQATLGPT